MATSLQGSSPQEADSEYIAELNFDNTLLLGFYPKT